MAERLTLTVEEAAELLGVSRALGYELVARGEIPSLRLGRRIVVPRRAIEAMLDAALDASEPRMTLPLDHSGYELTAHALRHGVERVPPHRHPRRTPTAIRHTCTWGAGLVGDRSCDLPASGSPALEKRRVELGNAGAGRGRLPRADRGPGDRGVLPRWQGSARPVARPARSCWASTARSMVTRSARVGSCRPVHRPQTDGWSVGSEGGGYRRHVLRAEVGVVVARVGPRRGVERGPQRARRRRARRGRLLRGGGAGTARQSRPRDRRG